MLNRRFDVYRRSALLVEAATLAASHAPALTPTLPYCVEIEVSAGTAAGAVVVTGTIAGVAGQAQTLTFTGPGRLSTTKLFDKNTAVAITTSGWTGTWLLTARAVGRDGAQLKELALLQYGWPGRIDRRPGAWGTGPTKGSEQSERTTLFVAYSRVLVFRGGDEVVDTASGERFRVETVPVLDDYNAPHHIEISVARAEQ